MHVTLIAPPWLPVPPPAYGGTEAVLDELARGLQAAGHHVRLVAHPDSTCPVDVVGSGPALRYELMNNSVEELHHVLVAHRELAGDSDVVHDHTTAGAIAAGALGVDRPLVVTNHGPFDRRTDVIYEAASRHADVIAISHAQAASTRVRCHVVHHGVDIGAFPMGQGDGGFVLFVGRMTPEKGIHRAIEVARRAGVRLVIAAKMREPAERQYFEQMVEPLLGSDVEYVGEVGGAQKLELYGRAAALLNPIEWPEPFGMVMLEAQACGTPVVASCHGSVPEVVTDGVSGYVCGDLTEMVERLRQVHRLDRQATRASVEHRFSTERMVADHVAIYERLAARRRSIGTLSVPSAGGLRPLRVPRPVLNDHLEPTRHIADGQVAVLDLVGEDSPTGARGKARR